MRPSVRYIDIASIERSRVEMERVGVDPAGAAIMAPKQLHYNFKVEGLTPAQANVAKQDMLAIGGEAAVAKGAASCSVPFSDAILSGTQKQFVILIDKLRRQSFGLPEVAEALDGALHNVRRTGYVIRSGDRSWDLGKRTLIMGILNVTPDSFSDGGLYRDAGRAVERGLELVEDGADWIDVGGESTRPGAEPVGAEEEMKRVLPVVEALAGKGVTVSVDTMKASVAKEALSAGASVINDVSALRDPGMAVVAAEAGVPVILMHMRGTPRTMQADVAYADLMGEVFNYLRSRVEYAVSMGIEREKIIIDPGIGFGKSPAANFELIARLRELKSLGRPVLVGHSRKSFIGATLGAGVGERVHGTMAVSAVAIMNGAEMLRVHDVKEARQAASMADAIREAARRA